MESLTEESRIDFEPCNLQEEAHFAFSSSNWLHYKSNIPESMFLRYLDYSIRRKKHDLLSHVRKILFCQQNNRSDIIGKSIDELFSALGNKGLQLKTSLLIASKHLIANEEYTRLSANINRNDFASLETSSCKKPDENPPNIDNTDSDAIHIADSFIENGQLNEAMDYLEQHLINNNENEQLAETLASVYIICDEKKRPNNLIGKLISMGKIIPTCLNTSTQDDPTKSHKSSKITQRNTQ